MDFLREYASNIDISCPSRTFCCLENESDICEDPERFGINLVSIHPHYCETNGILKKSSLINVRLNNFNE